ncbi:hypothetical protein [Clostridium sp.]|uniref:hypothetical protein n=1 Tax=Clostridium sp. TaxID=1506 RepID=UPI001A401520|nr:hypothetical protein [Clostridium sp.]MBK5240444.1 hypothetical protein [Clostridium sp.]
MIEIKSLIIILIGTVILQIFLSKRKNKWFGLILPIINIIYSIMAVLGLAAFLGQPIGEIIMQLIMVFLASNISTVILIAIYFACREKFKKKKEIDKMNIQDLE